MDQLIETAFAVGLDPTAASPLQDQLHEKLQSAILNGILPARTRLPASRLLAKRLHVSRNTVLAAYDQLIAEGYLETRQGAGTFVSADLPDQLINMPKPPVPKPLTSRHSNQDSLRADFGLQSGAPALDQFPKDVWARLMSKAWRMAGDDIFRHDDLAGYRPLREAIATYLQASRNVVATADQILIFSGLQQGFKLAAECLLPADATVFLENPGYGGMRRAAQTLSQRVRFVSVDRSGATTPQTKQRGMLVISPSRQFPLGITMPLARRLELLEWAQSTNSLILEDDYDSEFRYAGRPLNSLQSIDGGKHVLYGGSFSKTVFPALRLGYMVLPPEHVGRVLAHRAAVDSYPSIVPQIALAHFMESGHFARHIRRLRKTHVRRQTLFQESFNKHLGDLLTLEALDAGLHMIARAKPLIRHMTDQNLTAIARRAGIGVFPLSASYETEEGSTNVPQGILMGFANLEDGLIDSALKHFASLLRQSVSPE